MGLVDLSKLGGPDDFERFTADLLEAEGFSCDREQGCDTDGVDIIATERLHYRAGLDQEVRWFVQCKQRGKGGRSLGRKEIEEILNCFQARSENGLLIVTDTGITQAASIVLEAYCTRVGPHKLAKVWNRRRLESMVLSHPSVAAKYKLPGAVCTVAVEGEIDRTETLVQDVGTFACSVRPDDPNAIVRLRQGFGSLSLDDQEHIENPRYGALLRNERDAFLALFDAGYRFRILVSQRPFLAADICEQSLERLQTWRKWHKRCSNLIDFLGSAVERGLQDRIVAVYTPCTYLADIALGQSLLVKSTKTAPGPSYKSTIFTRDAQQIARFIDEFEVHMEQRIGEYAAEVGVARGALGSQGLLNHTIEALGSVRAEVADQVTRLEDALYGTYHRTESPREKD